MAGETLIEAPVPAAVPPQLTVYHFHDAPVPSAPALTLSIVESPKLIEAGLAMPVGVVESELTVSFAVLLVVLPPAFETTHAYCPESPTLTEAILKTGFVAAAIVESPFFH